MLTRQDPLLGSLRMHRTILLALAVATLALPANAAASGRDVLLDCADDEQLSRTYTQAEYQAALDLIPADGDQYTGCRAIIRAAQLRAAAGGGSTGGPSTGGPSTGGGEAVVAPPPPGVSPLDAASPGDKAAAARARAGGATPVSVGGAVIHPGDPGRQFSTLGDLPTALQLALLALLVALAGAIAHLVRTRGHRSRA